jgi:hypothetical protein
MYFCKRCNITYLMVLANCLVQVNLECLYLEKSVYLTAIFSINFSSYVLICGMIYVTKIYITEILGCAILLEF